MWRKREIQKIMTKNEALQKALDALGPTPPDCCGCQEEWQIAIDAIKEALANDTSQERVAKTSESVHEPVAWKLVPRDATDEMLKAMDECSTEGYDERLYAGHAASVFMAAVDAAPAPPQRTWVGLTDEDELDWDGGDLKSLVKAIETKLRSKND